MVESRAINFDVNVISLTGENIVIMVRVISYCSLKFDEN